MLKKLTQKLWQSITNFLTEDSPAARLPPSDFERLRYEIRFCDVLLVEGRSRVSRIIQSLTLSPWTHAAIYIGRLHAIDDPDLRDLIQSHYPAKPDEQLIIEALLGQGTIVAPLSKYRNDHLRICRPNNISRKDAQSVIAYSASKLGLEYDVRQLVDLARFLLPYRILPRHWLSSLFGQSTNSRTICSTMLAEAFASTQFPVRPILKKNEEGDYVLYDRNLKLYTPTDFDYSPYFDIIKYPIYGIDSPEIYRSLPWDKFGVKLDNEHVHSGTPTPTEQTKESAAQSNVPSKEHEEDEALSALAEQARDMLDEHDPGKPREH